MKTENDYLAWSAERLFELVRDEEGRRGVLEKKATLWTSGLLAVLGAIATTTTSPVRLGSPTGLLYSAGFVATVATMILAIQVLGARSSKAVDSRQLADARVLAADPEKRLRSLCEHLLEVLAALRPELNCKGKQVGYLQVTALAGVLCYLAGRFLVAVDV